MSKELLEEIEEHILKIDEDDSTNRSKMLDYRHWTYELLKIANEQAERVQELEEDCEYLSHHYGLEAEQNKRYSEIIQDFVDYAEHYSISRVEKQHLRKALEGEE